MHWNLYTRIKGKRRRDIHLILDEAFDWCIQKWGTSSHNPEVLWFNTSWRTSPSSGLYDLDENEITVFVKNHLNVRDLVDTVIHEFTHYMQPMYKYIDTLKETGYDNHPLEIEARGRAKEYRKECWNWIKNNLKQ